MPIQRTALLPAPSDAVARARRELAPRYGAQVWDGPDRRVLLVRVPRGDPDPVNDVEEAVEFLQAADVRDITHCLLVGDGAVAQVYARPLQDLMREREAFDRRIAASWRDRLPGRLGHAIFQAPDDPRRRWRLVVRLPLESVRDLDEEILEDLADGIGAELETQRFAQIVAVYLVAGADDVRLEADMFIQELRARWQSEERRRRMALEAAQRQAEDRRRREQERRQILREMEARIPKRTGARLTGHRALPASAPAQKGAGSRPASMDQAPAPRQAAHGSPAAQEPLAEATTVIRTRQADAHGTTDAPRTPEAAPPPHGASGRPRSLQVPHRVRELRARVDQVLGGTPRGQDAGREPVTASEEAGASASAPGLDETEDGAGQTLAPQHLPLEEQAARTSAPAALRGLQERLRGGGFETMVSPPTPGHIIDLAAERPGGDVQRIVVRAVERLDQEVAKQLLKTARELEVDLVLCVADATEQEALRLLVATKVHVAAPEELDRMAF